MSNAPRDAGRIADTLDREPLPETDADRRFFGRRKGHKLRVHQLDLIEQLLPRLALDIEGPGDVEACGFCRTRRAVRPAGRRRQAGNRIRRRRTFDRGSAGLSRCRVHRLRTLCQRHGEDPGADRNPQHRQYPAVRRRRRRIAGMGAAAFAGPDRSDPSRSMAEATALEAALRAGRNRCTRWRASSSHRPNFASSAISMITAPGRWRICCARPNSHWTAERADDWRLPWPDYTMTRYGRKAEREGRKAAYFRFRRIELKALRPHADGRLFQKSTTRSAVEGIRRVKFTRAFSISAGAAIRFGPSRSRISARTVAHSRPMVLPTIRIGS